MAFSKITIFYISTTLLSLHNITKKGEKMKQKNSHVNYDYAIPDNPEEGKWAEKNHSWSLLGSVIELYLFFLWILT